jgi:hypothetical protein
VVRRYENFRPDASNLQFITNPASLDGTSVPIGTFYASNGSGAQQVFGTFSGGGTSLLFGVGSGTFTFAVPTDAAQSTTGSRIDSNFPTVGVSQATLSREGYWENVPACAKSIATGPSGDAAWVMGCAASPGGYQIYRRANGGWQYVPGGVVRIAVERNTGNAWTVNNVGGIYEWAADHWVQHPGCATDIGVGDDRNNVWVVGCSASQSTGHEVYRYDPISDSFEHVASPGAVRIAVAPDTINSGGTSVQVPWIVDNAGHISYASSVFDGSWSTIDGCASSISVAAHGQAWITGCSTQGAGGSRIYRRSVSGVWELQPGLATQVAVSADGLSRWVSTGTGAVYRRIPTLTP